MINMEQQQSANGAPEMAATSSCSQAFGQLRQPPPRRRAPSSSLKPLFTTATVAASALRLHASLPLRFLSTLSNSSLKPFPIQSACATSESDLDFNDAGPDDEFQDENEEASEEAVNEEQYPNPAGAVEGKEGGSFEKKAKVGVDTSMASSFLETLEANGLLKGEGDDGGGNGDSEQQKGESETGPANPVSLQPPVLTTKEKKELAAYANSLGTKLKSQQVGKSGVTISVVSSFLETLEANELLKLKIHRNCPGELADAVKQLEAATGSVSVGQIGRTVILYRPSVAKLKAVEKRRQARSSLAPRGFRRKPAFLGKETTARFSGWGRRGSRAGSDSPLYRKSAR